VDLTTPLSASRHGAYYSTSSNANDNNKLERPGLLRVEHDDIGKYQNTMFYLLLGLMLLDSD
jgi:hypothetical protein